MNYLSLENLGKNYGERVLFEGLTFGLSQGDKMALIANNGTGKSSMLKIIAGADVSDEGSVTLRNGIRTGYLSQEPNFDNSLTIEKLITESQTEITKLIKEYEQALINIEKEHNSHNNKSLEELTAKWIRLMPGTMNEGLNKYYLNLISMIYLKK